MIRRLFVCPDLMRKLKVKRIMKSRRQFVIDNVAAWFLAPELAKRIEWLAEHENKPYLPRVNKPNDKLYAYSESGRFYLSLNTPFEDDDPGKITWATYFDLVDVDITSRRSVLDWAEESGRYYPDDGDTFSTPSPNDEVDDDLYEHYLDWGWCTNDSATAQAYHYLSYLDLGPATPNGEDPLGSLLLVQGPHPGSNATYAVAESEQTLSCLQHRLLELGEKVQLIVS